MKLFKKSVAALLALLMLVSVLPMSAFAASEAGEYNGVLVNEVGGFELIVDGDGDNDGNVAFESDDDPDATDTMGAPISGTALYPGNGTVNEALRLDWDDALSISATAQTASYTLTKFTEKFVTEEDGSVKEDLEPTVVKEEKISMWDGEPINVLVVYPDLYMYKKNAVDANESTNPSVYNTTKLINVLPAGTEICDNSGKTVATTVGTEGTDSGGYPIVTFSTKDDSIDANKIMINVGDIFEIWTSVVAEGSTTKYYLGSASNGYLSSDNAYYVDNELIKESLGKGLFNIKTLPLKDKINVHDETFNDNYNEYLDGSYDVIFFGTWDQNGSANVDSGSFAGTSPALSAAQYNGDLSKSAAEALHNYIKDGYGVLFGHDTVADASNLKHGNFMSFYEELGIGFAGGGGTRQNKVNVKEGLLTTFPYTIEGKLTVPYTHTVGQVYDSKQTALDATVWMTFDGGNHTATGTVTNGVSIGSDSVYEAGSSGKEISNTSGSTTIGCDAYLLSNKNVAMIQTGHSEGSATVNEIQVLANTLFFLKQKSLTSYALDGGFTDEAAPYVVESEDMEANPAEYIELKDLIPEGSLALIEEAEKNGEAVPAQKFTATITFAGEDVGTPYKYQVTAAEKDAATKQEVITKSNTLEAIALSEVKGYIIKVNGSAAECKDDMLNESKATDTNGRSYYKVTSTTGEYTTPQLDADGEHYIHIVPVDNANNPGNEVIVPLKLADIYPVPKVDTEIEAVIPETDKEDGIDEDSRVDDKDGDGENETYYYPHNYTDKDDELFFDEDNNGVSDGEPVQDEKITVDVTATVDALSRDDVVGVITVTKWDNDNIGEVAQREYSAEDLGLEDIVPDELKYGVAFEAKTEIDIDDIYVKELGDYEEDGNYTVTVTWYEKDKDNKPITDKVVAVDDYDFVIVQPDYEVEQNFLVKDEDGEAVEKTDISYVKYGDKPETPDAFKELVKTDDGAYFFDYWEMIDGKDNIDRITEDSVIEANYNFHTNGTAPEMPEKPEEPEEEKEVELERLGGEDRIETAIKISQEGWDKSKVVILATANQFPDAMAGVPLAKAVDAPILLTYNGSSLEVEVKAEIARLSPEKVYILGQTDAVNANIEKELKALYNVERVGGKDRFGTAVQIACEMEEVYGEKPDAVYFVRSDLFPDALSVSPVAAIEHNPILYVAPNGTVEAMTVAYSKTIGTEATIIGGPDAVNATAENNIKALYKSVDRIYGSDRYATSVEVCTAKEKLFTGDFTCLATGKKFPDALTGGSFAAKHNSPVLLVNGSVSPELAIYLANRPITKLYVFGGELAVSEEIAQTALEYCRYKYY